MRSAWLLLSAAFLAGCGGGGEQPDPLAGSTWNCVAFESAGEKQDGFKAELRFLKAGQKGRISLYGPQLGTYEFDYARNDEHEPHHIDLIDRDTGERILSIYSLEGDKLKLCYSMAHLDQRPEDFTTSPEGEQYSFVFRRND
jgi:uncharacterized protein (TIGR03067 family)